MFLIRSAFWLTVAFIALRPHDVDLGGTATALSGQAMAAGQRIVAEQVLNNGCAIIGCPGAAPVISAPQQAAPSPAPAPVDLAMQVSPAVRAAPVPRPRPAWLS